jgi:hypothetical protein
MYYRIASFEEITKQMRIIKICEQLEEIICLPFHSCLKLNTAHENFMESTENTVVLHLVETLYPIVEYIGICVNVSMIREYFRYTHNMGLSVNRMGQVYQKFNCTVSSF